ncbi:hypothetical protein HKX48_007739 [Thoreauomyces humboldtii]|nr:hypothetical protein HKX48_007739 [Thoreauomyces humboldtii]
MESMADIIVVSQLDLLDTAGTPRPPPTGSGTNRSSTIYRAPGPMAVRAPSHSALESQEMEESFEEDDDRTRLVAVKVEDPNASSDTVSELPRESKKEKENAKAKAKEEKLLHEPEISIMKSATLAEMDPDAVPKKSFFEANLGLLWMLLAAAQFTIMSISVKAMTTASERLPTLEIIFARSLLVWVMGVVCMFYWGVEDIWFGPKGVRGLLLLRSGIGFCGLVCGWWALSMLTLADATVLGFLSPVFTAILARFILKEPYALLDAVTGGLSMLGVLFIARPSFIFGSTTTSTDTTPDDLLASGAGSGFGAEGVAEEPGLASPSGSTAVATVEDSTQFLGVLIGLAGATFGALCLFVGLHSVEFDLGGVHALSDSVDRPE